MSPADLNILELIRLTQQYQLFFVQQIKYRFYCHISNYTHYKVWLNS